MHCLVVKDVLEHRCKSCVNTAGREHRLQLGECILLQVDNVLAVVQHMKDGALNTFLPVSLRWSIVTLYHKVLSGVVDCLDK